MQYSSVIIVLLLQNIRKKIASFRIFFFQRKKDSFFFLVVSSDTAYTKGIATKPLMNKEIGVSKCKPAVFFLLGLPNHFCSTRT